MGILCLYQSDSAGFIVNAIHSLVDDDMSQSEYNQLLVDAGLRKKQKQTSLAHGVSKDNWEAFCANYSIKYCEANVMNSCTINTWEINEHQFFFGWGGLLSEYRSKGADIL